MKASLVNTRPGTAADHTVQSAIRRRASRAPAPLSFAQERMWFLNQLEPNSSVYNVPRATRWSGSLDAAALERSLGEIVRRHEILRTRFPLTDEGVIQEVLPALQFQLPLRDLTGLPESARERAARQCMFEEAAQPFDLTRQPPFHATLLRLTEQEHWLILLIHHTAFDRWSRGVLLGELFALYPVFAAGGTSPLPEPPIQFSDYAAWQRERFQGDLVEREVVYWRERLRAAPPLLALPTDRARPARQTYTGARVSLRLPADLTESLGALARRKRATPFIVLLAAFKALLARFTGETDVVVGAPVAGRDHVELERLIGCFTNTLVLRTDLSGDPTFVDILDRVRGVTLDGLDHQELPFERLVEALRPPRDPRYHTLFQVLFNYLNFPHEVGQFRELRVEDVELPLEIALVDLAVDLRRGSEDWTCTFTYNTDLFDASTIARLARQYRAILEVVVSDPERPLSALLPDRSMGALDASERLLQELDQLSDDEAERLLAAEFRPDGVSDFFHE